MHQGQPPPPDEGAPEAAWGFEPQIMDALERLAKRGSWRLRRLVFDAPEDLSPVVADLYTH